MPTPTKLDSGLGQLKEELQDQLEVNATIVRSSEEKDADTRQLVAKWCMVGYFIGIILILFGVPLNNYIAWARSGDQQLLLDLKDTLIAYQAMVGALVGAVVAYYFKTQLDKTDLN